MSDVQFQYAAYRYALNQSGVAKWQASTFAYWAGLVGETGLDVSDLDPDDVILNSMWRHFNE